MVLCAHEPVDVTGVGVRSHESHRLARSRCPPQGRLPHLSPLGSQTCQVYLPSGLRIVYQSTTEAADGSTAQQGTDVRDNDQFYVCNLTLFVFLSHVPSSYYNMASVPPATPTP